MTYDEDITSQVIRAVQAVETAKATVQPYVGNAVMACDSVGDVFVTALKHLGHKTDGLTGQPEAAKAVFDVLKKQPVRRVMAQDAKASAARNQMFPHANRLRHG